MSGGDLSLQRLVHYLVSLKQEERLDAGARERQI